MKIRDFFQYLRSLGFCLSLLATFSSTLARADDLQKAQRLQRIISIEVAKQKRLKQELADLRRMVGQKPQSITVAALSDILGLVESAQVNVGSKATALEGQQIQARIDSLKQTRQDWDNVVNSLVDDLSAAKFSSYTATIASKITAFENANLTQEVNSYDQELCALAGINTCV